MKKKIYFLIGLSGSAVVVLALLFRINNTSVKNGFVRIFPPHVIGEARSLDLKTVAYNVAAIHRDTILVSNFSAPLYLLRSTLRLADTSSLLLRLPDSIASKLKQPSMEVNNGKVFLSDGNRSAVVLSDHENRNFRFHQYKSINAYSAILFMDNHRVLLRIYDVDLGQQVLVMLNTKDDHVMHRFVLEKKQDGLFSTDGKLNYNRQLSLFTYVYHYRNSFVLLDTSLHVIRTSHTLDTVSTGKLHLTYLKKQNEIAMLDPPLIVNQLTYTNGNWLYVYSGLKSDNEGKGFELNSVIDAYSLPDGTYRYSFYVPDFNGKKIGNFLIHQNLFITIQGTHLITYPFDPSGFRELEAIDGK